MIDLNEIPTCFGRSKRLWPAAVATSYTNEKAASTEELFISIKTTRAASDYISFITSEVDSHINASKFLKSSSEFHALIIVPNLQTPCSMPAY
jgi:hypothetical protein